MESTDWLRAAAETCLRRVYRDRGEALYFGSPIPGTAVPALFEAEVRPNGLALSPGAEALARFEGEARRFGGEDELLRLLLARKGRPIDGAEMKLWYRGMKLMAENAGPEAIDQYEKAVRQRAAVCLRENSGGALWASALCLVELKGRCAK